LANSPTTPAFSGSTIFWSESFYLLVREFLPFGPRVSTFYPPSNATLPKETGATPQLPRDHPIGIAVTAKEVCTFFQPDPFNILPIICYSDYNQDGTNQSEILNEGSIKMSSATLATDITTLSDTELLVACQQNPAQAARYIAQLRKESTQKDQTIAWHQAYEKKMHEIITNKDMSYSDRTFLSATLKNHPEEMMTLKPFQPNISRLRQETGLSPDSATKFFAAMKAAKGIRYSNKPQENEETGSYTSVSTIVPLNGYAQVNTKAAAIRIKQREEVKKRRARKLDTTIPCESCGSTDPNSVHAAIVPFCKKCGHIASEQQERHPAKNIRIIEEEVIPPSGEEATPSHEFADTEEWIEGDNDTELLTGEPEEWSTDPSHEFSAPAIGTSDGSESTDLVAQTNEEVIPQERIGTNPAPTVREELDTDSSHEFSEAPASTTNAPSEIESSDSPIGTTDPSHEFSAPATGTLSGDESTNPSTQTNEEANPSHEFSEGMRVDTPAGMGVISYIGMVHEKTRYRVRTNTLQRDGTYYTTCSANEMQPIVQASLL
jgi:hypothetical protein